MCFFVFFVFINHPLRKITSDDVNVRLHLREDVYVTACV